MPKSKYNITNERFVEIHRSCNNNKEFIKALSTELAMDVPLSYVIYKRNHILLNNPDIKLNKFDRSSHFDLDLSAMVIVPEGANNEQEG